MNLNTVVIDLILPRESFTTNRALVDAPLVMNNGDRRFGGEGAQSTHEYLLSCHAGASPNDVVLSITLDDVVLQEKERNEKITKFAYLATEILRKEKIFPLFFQQFYQ